MLPKLGRRFRPACPLLGLVAALWIASPARAEPQPGPRLRISARSPVHPGDRVEFAFEGERRGVDEFEILLSTDGGRTYPVRISEPLSPATRRLLWRVPRLSCKTIRLRVQFHRDGHEIEGDESVRVPLIGNEADDAGGTPVPQAVETEGPPLPSRGRGSARAGGSETEAGEDTDAGRRGALEPNRLAPSTLVPVAPPLPGAASATRSNHGGAPAFVPPRK